MVFVEAAQIAVPVSDGLGIVSPLLKVVEIATTPLVACKTPEVVPYVREPVIIGAGIVSPVKSIVFRVTFPLLSV